MKIYLHFNQVGQAYTLHEMAKYWKKTYGWDEYAGITIVKSNRHLDYLKKQNDIEYTFIDVIDDIERNALSYSADEHRIDEWEKRLNIPLWNLVIADRNIGHSFVKGGNIIKTDIMSLANHKNIINFVCCFLDLYLDRLTSFKPDFVFQPINAASLHSLALLKVCEYLGIPYYIPISTRINNQYLISNNNIFGRSLYLEECYARTKNDESYSISKEMLDYKDSFNTIKSTKPVWYHSTIIEMDKIKNRNFFEFYSSIARDFLSALIRIYRNRIKINRHLRYKHKFSNFYFATKRALAIRYYNNRRYEKSRIGEEPYVYFPLHLNPEATTMVLSPNFVDQQFVIDLLAKNIPISHKLYVKEHWAMIGRRPSQFYEQISSNPNVRIISPLEDSHALIRGASMVSAITGTAAWESAMMLKPTLIFGQCFYSKFGLVERCVDLDEISSVIKRLILKDKKDKKDKKIKSLLSCIERYSFDLPNDFFWGKFDESTGIDMSNEKLIRILSDKVKEVHEHR